MEQKLVGKTLGIIHAAVFTANTVAPYCKEIIPEVEIMHLGDDTIQRDNLAAPVGTIPKVNFFKFATYCHFLEEAGVDLIGAETMLSVEETMVVLDAAASVSDIPVMCSLTLEADGNAYYGGNGVEAMETLQAMGAVAVGVNCSVGPDQLENVIRNMKAVAEVPVIAKPNAGLPFIDDQGNAVYSMGPEEFAKNMKMLVNAGASVVGGCCGTTPAYIRKLRLALEGKLIR